MTVGVGLRPNPTVLHGATADVFLLEAGDGLHLVDRDVVELVERESVDRSRRLASIDWSPSRATPGSW